MFSLLTHGTLFGAFICLLLLANTAISNRFLPAVVANFGLPPKRLKSPRSIRPLILVLCLRDYQRSNLWLPRPRLRRFGTVRSLADCRYVDQFLTGKKESNHDSSLNSLCPSNRYAGFLMSTKISSTGRRASRYHFFFSYWINQSVHH